jgi:hypothetical protein
VAAWQYGGGSGAVAVVGTVAVVQWQWLRGWMAVGRWYIVNGWHSGSGSGAVAVVQCQRGRVSQDGSNSACYT